MKMYPYLSKFDNIKEITLQIIEVETIETSIIHKIHPLNTKITFFSIKYNFFLISVYKSRPTTEWELLSFFSLLLIQVSGSVTSSYTVY